MAVTIWRILRALQKACAPVVAVISFSFMLTFIFILYQPSYGPGLAQRLSWQSWDSITMPDELGTLPAGSITTGSSNQTDDDVEVPEGVDWWNVTTTTDTFDSTSLPLDVWTPLLPHDTGLSEITVTKCMMDPDMNEDMCAPDSTSQQDAIKGSWVRVERDLNMQFGYFSGWLSVYYRRTRRRDVKLITDIVLLPEDEQPEGDGWEKAETSLRAGVLRAPPLYLWYRLGKTAAEMNTEEKANLITELDVLAGEDVPWYGFEKLEPATTLPQDNRLSVWLTYRRGVKIPPKAPPLHFSHDGKFKIMQVADLHYSVSQGVCRDTLLDPCEAADNLTNSLLGRMLDKEKPDLIVFTGDQLNGQDTSWDPRSVLAKFARAVTDRQIPWAAVFGNHDEEDGMAKWEQVRLMKALPYSLVERGPRDVHGVANYVLKVKSADASRTHLLTLYFLDSGSYSKGFFDWWGFFTPTAYDWIHENQIDWFLEESASISPIERPFRPDSGRDIGHAWEVKRQSDQVTPETRKLAKPNAMMFFHIPLPEAYDAADQDPRTGKPLDVGIHDLEKPGNAKENGGMFQNGLLKAEESDHVARHAPEVKVVANGHCHRE
ncbi:hypothetical protein AX16_009173 [Volvariella volvacea WC 439]|nr:hypothetical protein AX16_009173 [Volvariella volvacea WC 439]